MEEHHLIHYYFTGWPDYNVVEPRKLLDLIETINKHRFYLNKRTIQVPSAPTVVHCRYQIKNKKRKKISIFLLVRVLVELELI